jgi:3-methylcrotonyl-CoA carboxylase alpha subunit
VQLIHGHNGSLEVADRRAGVAMHMNAVRLKSGDIAVFERGETWTLSLYDPFAAAEEQGGTADRITAPMPGKVIQVLVRPGDAVKRGQPLAVLEAMKMEHTLSASADALVATVDVSAGDQVNEGAVIVRFAKEKNEAA